MENKIYLSCWFILSCVIFLHSCKGGVPTEETATTKTEIPIAPPPPETPNLTTRTIETDNWDWEVSTPNYTISTENLVEKYKPKSVYNYHEAREILYREIYNEDNTITCMYSGYQLSLDKTEKNPISKLLKMSPTKSIITEHSYPKSKGAKTGNAKSDMHHLFPVRLGVNVARLNYPFAEVSDEECESWYRFGERYTTKPKGDDGLFCKKGNEKFEPQNSFKGNVARAVFYFYTMYRKEADGEDPNFFELQRKTLLQWHKQDPVDADELRRTHLIAAFQDDKPNPFILDSTLAKRMYGD